MKKEEGNIQDIFKFAEEKNTVKIKDIVSAELYKRSMDAIENMKKDVANDIFK